MDRKVSPASPARQSVISDLRPKMAKAEVRKTDSPDSLKEFGECLDFARRYVGWTLDELANKLPPPTGSVRRDPRQVARWIRGEDPTPLAVVFKVEALRLPFVIALARLVDCCEEETTIRFRRRA